MRYAHVCSHEMSWLIGSMLLTLMLYVYNKLVSFESDETGRGLPNSSFS